MPRSTYAQLHQYLLDAITQFKAAADQHDIPQGKILIEAAFEYNDEISIKYTVNKRYEQGPTGNELGAVMEEFFRRNGWDIANNTKLIGQ